MPIFQSYFLNSSQPLLLPLCSKVFLCVCVWRGVLAAAAAKSNQSCLTPCDPTDSSPPGSPVPGIFQARTLEWVAISFSNAWKWKVKVKSLSHVRLIAIPWTAAYQAPLSVGFPAKWSGMPLPSLRCSWVNLTFHCGRHNCPGAPFSTQIVRLNSPLPIVIIANIPSLYFLCYLKAWDAYLTYTDLLYNIFLLGV